MPNKELGGGPSEELRTRKAHRTSDDETEDSGSKSPGTRLRKGLAIRDMDVGEEEKTESARAEGEALKAQRTKQMVQKIMRCTAEVMVHQQDLADAKASEVAAQQGLAEAQLRVAEARQELVDGIQNGLLIKVRTFLVEEALMTTVIRDGEPMDEGKRIMIPEHEPEPPAPEVEYAAREHTPGELCLQAIIKAGLSTSLPRYEKNTCAWDLQLRRDMAGLLSLYQLGRYTSPSRKQSKKKEPRALAAIDPSDDWTNPCVMGSKCRKRHSPAKCAEFKKLIPEARLAHILTLGLCQLCYRHPDTRKCWSLGKVPGCSAPGCGANHHTLLHGAISRGRVMMTRSANNVLPEILLYRQMVSVEIGGRNQQLQVLYDSGATVTLITHEAADRTGLQPIWQQLKSVSGLNGVVVASSCFYMVPMVDCNDELQVIKAFGVARIAWMDQGTLPPEMEARFPRLKGETINLQQDEGYVDLLIRADNSRWMPAYVGSSEFPFDNLHLMMSSFGERYILMGSPGKQTGASPRVDAESNWQNAIRDLGSVTNTGARFRGVMRPLTPPQGLVGASAQANVLQGPGRAATPALTPRGPPRNAPPVADARILENATRGAKNPRKWPYTGDPAGEHVLKGETPPDEPPELSPREHDGEK
jgi:hypothetical protein